MPKKRYRVPPGSKVVLIEKKWWWPFGARLFHNMDSDINQLKGKHVKLQREIASVELAIAQAEKDKENIIKTLEKSKLRAPDGSGLTEWKEERLPWYKLSIFQWAKPYVPEPPEFDTKLVLGRAGVKRRERPKEMQVAIDKHEKNRDKVREQMLEGGVENVDNTFLWKSEEPDQRGKSNNHWKNKRKGETDQEWKDRLRNGKPSDEGNGGFN